jgi:hypothetical protein
MWRKDRDFFRLRAKNGAMNDQGGMMEPAFRTNFAATDTGMKNGHLKCAHGYTPFIFSYLT